MKGSYLPMIRMGRCFSRVPKTMPNNSKLHSQNAHGFQHNIRIQRIGSYFLGVLIFANTLASSSSRVALSPGNKFLYTLKSALSCTRFTASLGDLQRLTTASSPRASSSLGHPLGLRL